MAQLIKPPTQSPEFKPYFGLVDPTLIKRERESKLKSLLEFCLVFHFMNSANVHWAPVSYIGHCARCCGHKDE